jgi:hypothetical protein
MVYLKNIFVVAFLGIALFFSACNNGGNNVEEQIDDSINEEEMVSDDLDKAKQVFYSLPSPIETAMLMKRAGAKYNEEFLNNIANLPNYTTTKSMALNLGVFSADLSFASMFDQSQASVKYLTATKKLAENLGILNAVEQSTVKRMEGNVNNRDSLMEIISETLMNSNSFLKENDRAEVAALILAGGWIEGLYIATKIAKSTAENKELVNRIVDQRLSLKTLNSLLEEYKTDENIKAVYEDLKKISDLYDQVEVSTSKIEMVEAKGESTTLKSKTDIQITDKVFNEICTTVDKLRNNITK